MEECASVCKREDGVTEAKPQFEKQVVSQFNHLLKRGFHPNRAAAYALKLVSKTGVQDDCAAQGGQRDIGTGNCETPPCMCLLKC